MYKSAKNRPPDDGRKDDPLSPTEEGVMQHGIWY